MAQATRGELAEIRHYVLDLDGTVYTDERLHVGTARFFAALRRRGLGHTFLTNNTSRRRQDYVDKLRRLGLEVDPGQVSTPVAATVAQLRRCQPLVERLFVLGTEGLQQEFAAAGFSVDAAAQAAPDAVVVGFDTTLNYQRLCRAAWWISQQLPYLATHPDLVCPTREPTVLVDCGAICAALQAATGRQPDAVMGKPEPAMLQRIAADQGLQPSQLAMVGDRLMTDMKMARRAGALAVLVLTGEASRADIEALPVVQRPDLVVEDLSVLASGL